VQLSLKPKRRLNLTYPSRVLQRVISLGSAAKKSGPLHFVSSEAVPMVAQAKRGSAYSRVTDTVAFAFTDPDAPASPAAGVAVMVAVDVTGVDVDLEDVPPHAETNPKPTKRTTSNMNMESRLRFLKPKKQSAAAKVAGKIGLKSWRATAAVAGGVMVSVVVTVVPAGKPVVAFWAKTVTGFGLKVQV